MAKSRFEYVRNFELPDPLLPGTFIVVRIDGRGFHKFSDTHVFEKPNDVRALQLMDRAAMSVMEELGDVVLAFGESDEYSFLIRRSSNLYNRRRSKINSTVVSIFTSSYVFHWGDHFPSTPLRYPPSFDSRVVLYPGSKEVRDYFAWRQADTHINNLQNTSFWALVKEGLSTTEANRTLQGTDSKGKNELLFSRFGVNYNNLPERYRKGSTIVRVDPTAPSSSAPASPPDDDKAKSDQAAADLLSAIQASWQSPHGAAAINAYGDTLKSSQTGTGNRGEKAKRKVKPYEGMTGELVVLHEDIIGDDFWTQRAWLLA